MSKKIKETPTLYGKDAENFLKRLAESVNKRIPKEELDKMKESYENIKKISKDMF